MLKKWLQIHGDFVCISGTFGPIMPTRQDIPIRFVKIPDVFALRASLNPSSDLGGNSGPVEIKIRLCGHSLDNFVELALKSLRKSLSSCKQERGSC